MKSDGSVITWGHPNMGGDSGNVREQLRGEVQRVYSTGWAFAAVKSDGSVITWGDPDYGGYCDDVLEQLTT